LIATTDDSYGSASPWLTDFYFSVFALLSYT